MKYKFIGKPDKVFPFLKTGKVYDLKIKEQHKGLFGLWGSFPQITEPIMCPYSSWDTFYQNWRPV